MRGAEDPTAGDPTAGDPTAEDPTAGDPTAGDPTAGDDVREDLRYEFKLIGEGFLLPELRTRLVLNPIGLRPIHHPRRINSLYLDTHDGRALEENLAGLSHREKIRLRWYGEAARGVSGVLEKKVRHNLLGWKERAPVEGAIDIEDARRCSFVRALADRVPPSWRGVLMAGLDPVQWITYEREYLATSDGRLRVTLDGGLRACDQRHRARLSSRWSTPIPDYTVVECKAAPVDYELVQGLVNDFPLLVDKCSKFVMASSPGEGPLRSVLPF